MEKVRPWCGQSSYRGRLKVKVKVGFLYSAAYAMTGPARFTISEVAVDWQWYCRTEQRVQIDTDMGEQNLP